MGWLVIVINYCSNVESLNENKQSHQFCNYQINFQGMVAYSNKKKIDTCGECGTFFIMVNRSLECKFFDKKKNRSE